jgi:hypothetical protein
VRAGIQFQYHLSPRTRLDPWIGAGWGIEWSSVHMSNGTSVLTDFDLSAWGIELFQVQTGFDFALLDRLALGPFLSLSFNSYEHVETSCSGEGCAIFQADISDRNPSVHLWLFVGVRGRYTTPWL